MPSNDTHTEELIPTQTSGFHFLLGFHQPPHQMIMLLLLENKNRISWEGNHKMTALSTNRNLWGFSPSVSADCSVVFLQINRAHKANADSDDNHDSEPYCKAPLQVQQEPHVNEIG